MIKAVFFDVDRTLLDLNRGCVPESTRSAVRQLRSRGIQCLVATGRCIMELDRLPVRDMEFDGYITLNGQLCLDRHREPFYASPLPEQATELLVEMFRERKLPLMLVEKDRIYANYVDDLVRRVHGAILSKVPELGEYAGAPLYQVCAYLESGVEELERSLPGCRITRWHMGGVDIISQSGGKVAGIEAYMARYGIRREEVMAFGDGENDIEMLRFTGTGVAMGNAGDEVKANADYVTADIGDDGIWKALTRFDLI